MTPAGNFPVPGLLVTREPQTEAIPVGLVKPSLSQSKHGGPSVRVASWGLTQAQFLRAGFIDLRTVIREVSIVDN